MSAYSETVNVIMKSRVRESRTHGSVRGWHREVPVYSTMAENDSTFRRNLVFDGFSTVRGCDNITIHCILSLNLKKGDVGYGST